MEKYNATYMYIGKEELKKVPGCYKKFEESEKFEKVYDSRGIKIYKLNLGPIPLDHHLRRPSF